jgi:hypothetical protein
VHDRVQGPVQARGLRAELRGFNAFFVALVPNNFTAVLNQAKSTSVSVGEFATRDQLLSNLRFVLTAFLITAVLFTFFDYKLMNWRALKWGKDETKFAGALAVVSWVTEIIFLVLIVGNVLVGRETLFGGPASAFCTSPRPA